MGFGLVLRSENGNAVEAGSTGIDCGGILCGFGGRTLSAMIGSRTAFLSFSFIRSTNSDMLIPTRSSVLPSV